MKMEPKKKEKKNVDGLIDNNNNSDSIKYQKINKILI